MPQLRRAGNSRQRVQNLRRQVSSLGLWQRPVLAAVRPQLASRHVLHDDGEHPRPSEGVHAAEAHHGGVAGQLLQYVTLKHHVRQLHKGRQS